MFDFGMLLWIGEKSIINGRRVPAARTNTGRYNKNPRFFALTIPQSVSVAYLAVLSNYASAQAHELCLLKLKSTMSYLLIKNIARQGYRGLNPSYVVDHSKMSLILQILPLGKHIKIHVDSRIRKHAVDYSPLPSHFMDVECEKYRQSLAWLANTKDWNVQATMVIGALGCSSFVCPSI